MSRPHPKTDPRPGRGSWIAAFAVLAVLGGCSTIGETAAPPNYDQATVDALASIKSESSDLFAALLKADPDCRFANNAAAFSKIEADIAALGQHTAQIPHNAHTTTAVADLGANLDHFGKADSGGANCLPATLVQDEQAAFDGLVQNLVAYEQKKPRGA